MTGDNYLTVFTYGCDLAHIGEFYDEYDGRKYNYERTKNKQIETIENIESKYAIHWIDECRYTLKLISTNDPNRNVKESKTMTINIFLYNENEYSFIGEMPETGYLFTGKMFRK